MADYSNFLSEADGRNLQYEVIFCKKINIFLVINLHNLYIFLFDFLRSFRQQNLKVIKSRKQFLLIILNSSQKRRKYHVIRALKIFRFRFSLVFGRIENSKNCFRDLLTFKNLQVNFYRNFKVSGRSYLPTLRCQLNE